MASRAIAGAFARRVASRETLRDLVAGGPFTGFGRRDLVAGGPCTGFGRSDLVAGSLRRVPSPCCLVPRQKSGKGYHKRSFSNGGNTSSSTAKQNLTRSSNKPRFYRYKSSHQSVLGSIRAFERRYMQNVKKVEKGSEDVLKDYLKKTGRRIFGDAAVRGVTQLGSVFPLFLIGYAGLLVLGSGVLTEGEIPVSQYASFLNSARLFAFPKRLDFHKDRMVKVQMKELSIDNRHELEDLQIEHKQMEDRIACKNKHVLEEHMVRMVH